jgi:hypothetical protein
MISTTDKPEDKREKLRKLREFHQETFNQLDVPNAVFVPKMAYRPYGKTELHIGFFASEISKGEDVYVEFCSRENDPEDPLRRLYKWRFNPHFEEEYEKTEPNGITGNVRYLVPVDELSVVKIHEEVKSGISTNNTILDFDSLPDPDNDLPFDQMTMRDFAAIMLKKPVSNKKWLNDLITK